MSEDDSIKFTSLPVSWTVEELEKAAAQGPSIMERYREKMRVAEAEHHARWDSLTPGEQRRERAAMVGLFTPVIEPVPMHMEFGPIQIPPVDFIFGSRFGGMEVRRPQFRITTDVGPWPRHYHTDSRRKQKRARCKARRRARLPRRHWVRRARRMRPRGICADAPGWPGMTERTVMTWREEAAAYVKERGWEALRLTLDPDAALESPEHLARRAGNLATAYGPNSVAAVGAARDLADVLSAVAKTEIKVIVGARLEVSRDR